MISCVCFSPNIDIEVFAFDIIKRQGGILYSKIRWSKQIVYDPLFMDCHFGGFCRASLATKRIEQVSDPHLAPGSFHPILGDKQKR